MLSAPAPGPDDRVLPFSVEALDSRGRIVRLGPAIDAILARHDYPAPVSRLLGQAAALAILLGASLKFDGRFQLQTQTDGAIDLIVVDFETPGRVRAYARFDKDRVFAESAAGASPSDLLGKGHLALTIEQGAEAQRYQGIVALEGQGLEEAAHRYFSQSEQIPTRLRLAVGETLTAGGGGRHSWRAGGLIVQFLPPASRPAHDLAPGDAPAGQELPAMPEDDAWVEARSLLDTVEDHELLDPLLTSEALLYRLFHERGVRVHEAGAVEERCRCSRDRIVAMLRSFAEEERVAMIGENGRIGVTCEFCSSHYDIAPAEIGAP